jgi:predicted AlkP superfamily phosphohydrolase/phosphomutase
LLPLADGSVAVNTVDRKGGIVPLDEKPRVLAEVRKILERVKDPETGQRVVKAFFEPSTKGLLQPGGETTGDLFMDLSPGYFFSDRTVKDEILSHVPPVGNHIFVPTRRDMLAICGAWGPKVPPGTNWGRVRAIDIAPTLLRLLGLPIPPELPGESLLANDPLVR